MNDIVLKSNKGRTKIYTPYYPDFVREIKKIGGARWNSSSRCWSVPEEMTDAVREIIKSVYGYTDQDPATEMVNVIVRFKSDVYKTQDSYDMFGKVLSRAWSRDSGAIAGDDVIYLEGNPESGGSKKHWDSIVPEGSVVKIINIPKGVYESKIEDLKKHEDYYTIEIEGTKIDREALLVEKEKLLARLEEIEKILSDSEKNS